MLRVKEGLESNNINRSKGTMVSVWGMSCQESRETMEV